MRITHQQCCAFQVRPADFHVEHHHSHTDRLVNSFQEHHNSVQRYLGLGQLGELDSG